MPAASPALLVPPHTPIAKLTPRLKGYTAREANLMLGRTGGAFWQPESCDHWVRIENNPVAVGLAARPEGRGLPSPQEKAKKKREGFPPPAQVNSLQ